ncbi:hypothetical protein CH282_26155 [Rhodococcus sp. 06-418-1B]|nr:bifunctional DNA primase/polymerase [Rhodococcus sp. 06-418-1B]OZC76364.1 hypothetical protein CH282_26155 [Rhodococcus sp. 06-418-1B]
MTITDPLAFDYAMSNFRADDKRSGAKAVQGTGAALLLLEAASKVPVANLRTRRQRTADETYSEAQMLPKPKDGVGLSTGDVERFGSYIDRFNRQPGRIPDSWNVGIGVHQSGLIVVDVDTPEEGAAFDADCAEHGIELSPSVTTPGAVKDGVAVHSHGRHYYFVAAPGQTLPTTGTGTWKAPGGYAVYWRERYMVAPPSIRAEGAYVWHPGNVVPLPTFLYERITAASAPKARRVTRSADGSPIDDWAAQTPWADVLGPAGWMETGTANCGCATWLRPGSAEKRSAIAHDDGCTLTGYTSPFLHSFSSTSEAELGQDVSKLKVVAALHHGGSVGRARTALGIPDDQPEFDADAFVLEGASADPYDEALEAVVFDHSEVTKHIREQARLRLVSPWAALFMALMHAVLSIPYGVRLPAIVGSPASLNSMLAAVGGSGGGKGVSSNSVADFVTFVDDPLSGRFDGTKQSMADAITPIAPGSGEALSVAFRDLRDVVTTDEKGKQIRTKKFVTVRRAALFAFAEVDSTTALMQRNSSTLSAELRKMWDGGPIGVHTKTVERRSSVGAFEYRAVVTFGVQPERAEALLDGEDGGLPQRLLWVGTADPHVPDEDEGEHSRLDIPMPDWPSGDKHVTMAVAEPIQEQIRRDRKAVLRNDDGALTGLHSHRNLVRLKLAAAVAVLHGRGDVSEQDWDYAEALLTHSDRVRSTVQRAVGDAARQRSAARGVADAHREQGKAAETSRRIQKAADGTAGWLRKRPTGPVTRGEIQRAAKSGSDRRLYLDDCLALLIDDGVIRVVPDSDPTAYELVTK